MFNVNMVIRVHCNKTEYYSEEPQYNYALFLCCKHKKFECCKDFCKTVLPKSKPQHWLLLKISTVKNKFESTTYADHRYNSGKSESGLYYWRTWFKKLYLLMQWGLSVVLNICLISSGQTYWAHSFRVEGTLSSIVAFSSSSVETSWSHRDERQLTLMFISFCQVTKKSNMYLLICLIKKFVILPLLILHITR